jgi:hypothetical protein
VYDWENACKFGKNRAQNKCQTHKFVQFLPGSLRFVVPGSSEDMRLGPIDGFLSQKSLVIKAFVNMKPLLKFHSGGA